MTESTTSPSPAKGATKARAARTAAKTDTGPITVAAAETAAEPGSPAPAPASPPESTQVMDVPPAAPSADGAGPSAGAASPHATAPVTVRPRPRGPRRGPLTRMGPWAPVAGGMLGLLAGVVAVLFLAGEADAFAERLALVLLVVGLGILGAAGTLLADEVRMVRQGAREAAVRPAWVEATAPLLSGLTPGRLLLVLSAFVLFLSAYVIR
jgi:hypothetical protein